jgi:cell wall assembly regulator SMI1
MRKSAGSSKKKSGTKKATTKANAKSPPSVAERWDKLAEWLRKNEPEALKEFRSPATPKAIAAAEKALGRALPDDYKAFLAIHNGQKIDGPMVESASLLRVEEIAARYKRLCRMEAGEDEESEYDTDKKVKPLFYSPGWIPIACSPRGRDFLCLDFDPAKAGKPGQVILFVTDFNERFQVAPSFAELLTVFLKEAKAGEIDF